ncbi:hypothetical protein ACPWT1_15155 [Ramlibacter sp. MMS24-I3-19]|uniref:hypothetical protein n=1 Tax=Ramlibacter sp. MMS24-I3-19 TaxID=3416606 RepID=UPI003CFCCB22
MRPPRKSAPQTGWPLASNSATSCTESSTSTVSCIAAQACGSRRRTSGRCASAAAERDCESTNSATPVAVLSATRAISRSTFSALDCDSRTMPQPSSATIGTAVASTSIDSRNTMPGPDRASLPWASWRRETAWPPTARNSTMAVNRTKPKPFQVWNFVSASEVVKKIAPRRSENRIQPRPNAR